SFIHEEAAAFIVVEREHLIGEIGDDDAGQAGVIVVGSIDTHARARDAVFAEGDPGNDGLFAEGAVAVVVVQLVGLGVVGKEQVGPAMVVVIQNGHAQRLGGGVGEASPLRGILERAVTAIVPKAHGSAFVGFGCAVRFALAVERAVKIALRRPLDVVRHDEIEVAVLVVIDPGGARAEFLG